MRVSFPGFFDLQVNGFGGIDFNGPGLTPELVVAALDRMGETGVTRCLPTLITSSADDFSTAARILAGTDDARIAGLHMEGPYISPAEGARGAHPAEHIRDAAIDDFKRRQEAAGGRIVLVTLAPEVNGAVPMIEYLVAAGVRVALGHTAADAEAIADGVAAGATLATHLGNGCAQMLPRHPNAIWELLAADAVSASFIVDGHHLPPATVKSMIRAKSLERSILVTDAIAAAGCKPGRYQIGAVTCELGANGRVSLPGTPYLAGSGLTMDTAVANTVRFTGLTFSEAVRMASINPAAYLGLSPAGTVDAEWDPDRNALTIESVSTRTPIPAAGHLEPPGSIS
jgi:N-acetylglucosamine-6-phosphate deacetylase